jgi:hypothetical protein
MPDALTFAAATFAVDKETRTLTGVLLPFGAVSRPAADPVTGKTGRFSFASGTVTLPDPGEVVLNYGHDGKSLQAQVGIATHLSAEPDGIHAKFRIARTPEGDRVLALAEDRILRAFSAEVEGEFVADRAGVQHAKAAALTGAAVVPKPAFVGAQITSVAASAADKEEEAMTNETTEVETAEVSFTAAEGANLAAQIEELTKKVDGLAEIKVPVQATANLSVVEEPIYRFAGTTPAPSGFDFAEDLLNAARYGDQAAFKRVQEFTASHLNPEFVTTGNTAQVNPATYRPDMFLGQAPVPTSPLYDTFHAGALSSVQPFFHSKLDRAATTVGVTDHVEGTDPALTNLVTVAGATVTPAPVSGRVHITREVGDQGGNPQISGMIWAEFDRSFKIALETKTTALLTAAAGSITSLTAAIAAGANGQVAGQAIEAGLLGLQFLADGSRFTKTFGHVDLYKALATFENADGEKRYPIINPQNRDGIAGAKYSFLDIAGYRMEPAASLGATSANASNSYVVDPSAVKVWNSGLTRLDKLTEKVEGWDLGVFAYWAGLVYDISGLRKIAYDPAP